MTKESVKHGLGVAIAVGSQVVPMFTGIVPAQYLSWFGIAVALVTSISKALGGFKTGHAADTDGSEGV